MEHKNIDNLVIFSTLNQITNYIAIRALKPKNIYNITFDEGLAETFKYGIDPTKWDDNLKKVLDNKKIQSKINPILITESMYKDLEEFKIKLEDKMSIKSIDENIPIYWHITGGQRVFAMAIYEIIKNRPNDILFYLEGNSEEIITMAKNKENRYKFKSKMKYELEDLDFKKSFQLMGYDAKDLKSTLKLKEKGEIVNEEFVVEKKFYNDLYQWIFDDGRDKIFKIDGEEGTFKELLLLSNLTKKFINKEIRQEFLNKLFKKVKNECTKLKVYDIENSEEMGKGFPAGYIFEKLVGYKIFDVVKDNPKILGMEMSLKVYKEKFSHIVDELDIVLLTNTGRILNFECKSGSLEGDNAKSHHFTTYSLSGIFGAPIFMTPLSQKSEELRDDIYYKLLAATQAAEKANIKTIYLKTIEDEIKNLIGEQED